MFKQAPVRRLTCQKKKKRNKKTENQKTIKKSFFSLCSKGLLKLYQWRNDESFAFTSNVDDWGGRGSVRENEGGLRSSCTS